MLRADLSSANRTKNIVRGASQTDSDNVLNASDTVATVPEEAPLKDANDFSDPRKRLATTPISTRQVHRLTQSFSTFLGKTSAKSVEQLRRLSFPLAETRRRRATVDISQNFGAGLLPSGQESHKGNVEEFDRYMQLLQNLERHPKDEPFDAVFWGNIRSLLRQASHPIGFFPRDSKSPSKVIGINRHHVDALADRMLVLQTTLVPMFPAKFYALQEQERHGIQAGLQISEEAMLTELLYATRVGLVSMFWTPKCVSCGLELCYRMRLKDLPDTETCRCCRACNTLDLLDRVSVTFEFNKDILPLPPNQIYLPLGREITSSVFPPEIVSYRILVPSTPTGSMFRFSATSLPTMTKAAGGCNEDAEGVLSEGRYTLLALPQRKFFVVVVERDATEKDVPVTVRMQKESFKTSDEGGARPEIVVPHGKVHFDFESSPDMVYLIILLRVEKASAMSDMFSCHKCQVMKVPYTSASQMLHHATFQRLFGSDQVVSANPDAKLSIRHVVLVFTDIVGSTNMYATMGDGEALSMVRRHFEVLFGAFSKNGRVVKTVGDAVMASFITGRAAMEAVASALTTLQEECVLKDGTPLRIRVGVHAGSTVVVPLNGINDYFGQTVNMAARVEAAAGGNECFVTQAVLAHDEDAAVAYQEILQREECFEEVGRRELTLKGIQEPVEVQGFRLR